MKAVNLTGLDSKEIPRYTFDEQNQSIRVTVVAGEMPEFKVAAQKIEAAPVESKIEYITVKEVQIVEIPVYFKEIEYKTIEVPVITVQKDIQIIEIEKPIVVKEFEKIEVPVIQVQEKIVYVDKINYKLLFILQAITLGLIVVSKFLKT